MLTQIDVVYDRQVNDTLIEEQALALPIVGITPKDSLLVRRVTGLNPPDIDLFIGDYARDGGKYQGRRVGNRNVVLTLDLNPNPALGQTVSGLRDILYQTFIDPLVDADHIELVFNDDTGLKRNVYGYTEKFETDLFDIETAVQISIICPDPYIRDVTETVHTNPVGTWSLMPFTYLGTAETGFEVQIDFTAPVTSLTLKNNGKQMVVENNFAADESIYINTNRGSRDIRWATKANITTVRNANPTWSLGEVWAQLVSDGNTYPMAGKQTSDSKWIELHSRGNVMTVETSGAGIKTLAYRSAYWGI